MMKDAEDRALCTLNEWKISKLNLEERSMKEAMWLETALLKLKYRDLGLKHVKGVTKMTSKTKEELLSRSSDNVRVAESVATNRSVGSVKPEHIGLVKDVSRKECSRAAAAVVRLRWCWFISELNQLSTLTRLDTYII